VSAKAADGTGVDAYEHDRGVGTAVRMDWNRALIGDLTLSSQDIPSIDTERGTFLTPNGKYAFSQSKEGDIYRTYLDPNDGQMTDTRAAQGSRHGRYHMRLAWYERIASCASSPLPFRSVPSIGIGGSLLMFACLPSSSAPVSCLLSVCCVCSASYGHTDPLAYANNLGLTGGTGPSCLGVATDTHLFFTYINAAGDASLYRLPIATPNLASIVLVMLSPASSVTALAIDRATSDHLYALVRATVSGDQSIEIYSDLAMAPTLVATPTWDGPSTVTLKNVNTLAVSDSTHTRTHARCAHHHRSAYCPRLVGSRDRADLMLIRVYVWLADCHVGCGDRFGDTAYLGAGFNAASLYQQTSVSTCVGSCTVS
jgi:hypothetical protein